MKLLLDTCVWGPAADTLRAAGHDVVHVGEWVADPGDAEILRRAWLEGRVLVTLDKDFGMLAMLTGQPHAGIVRLVGIASREQASACERVLDDVGELLPLGAMVTVAPGRVRIRGPVLRSGEPIEGRAPAAKGAPGLAATPYSAA